ncbi:MAG: O-antigen ligase family protein [Candidatus Omnitrophica bacterium]|nr:O-antigen ligase family protein [Candidatus Omnitrophota bacterium]
MNFIKGSVRNMPSADNPYIKLWKWCLYGVPLWWVIGLSVFAYHLVALMLFASLVYARTREDQGIYLPLSFWPLFFMSLVHAFSLFIHAGPGNMDRAVASTYNLSFWVMGWMLIVVMANAFTRRDLRSMLRAFYWVAFITGGLALFVFVMALTGKQDISFPSLLYQPFLKIMGRSPLIEYSLWVKPLHYDWFVSSSRPRFTAFCPYSTATGTLTLILLMMLMTWAAVQRKTKNLIFFAVFFLDLLALAMTLSRTAVVAFIMSTVAVFVFQKQRALLWIIVFVFGVLMLAPWIWQLLEWILTLRPGSTTGRLELYRYSLQQFEGIDWIIGFGLKPREDSAFVVPIGSHSTYLSILFKTGIIGVAAFVFFQIQLLYRWLRFREQARHHRNLFFLWSGVGGVLIGMILCLFTGDIDGPQLLAFVYFSIIGIFEGCVHEQKTKTLMRTASRERILEREGGV